jgi:hypothetical protein
MSPVNFPLGQVVATPGVLAAFEASGQASGEFLQRHASGDWGELSAADKRENELSVRNGYRILSAYRLKNGVRFWVITEADRSSTWVVS